MKDEPKLKDGGLTDREIDSYYEFIWTAISRHEFGLVDAMLEYVSGHILDFNTDQIITLLTTTLKAKTVLPHRHNLYLKAKRILTEEGLLKGLET